MTGFAQSIITIVLFIFILGVLVIIHELGHFLTARAFRVRVLEFGIGFPPRAKVMRSQGRDPVHPQLAAHRWLRQARRRGRQRSRRPALVRGAALPGPHADPPRRGADERGARVRHLHRDRPVRRPDHRRQGIGGPARVAGGGGRPPARRHHRQRQRPGLRRLLGRRPDRRPADQDRADGHPRRPPSRRHDERRCPPRCARPSSSKTAKGALGISSDRRRARGADHLHAARSGQDRRATDGRRARVDRQRARQARRLDRQPSHRGAAGRRARSASPRRSATSSGSSGRCSRSTWPGSCRPTSRS